MLNLSYKLEMIWFRGYVRGVHRSAVYRDRKVNENVGDTLRYGDEQDIDDADSNLDNISYGQHRREIAWKRNKKEKMMTIKKFFSGPKPPNMLTWAERIQIKQLHDKDPEEWNIEVLADSFPATKETISKILQTKWKPENLEDMKRKDNVVRENWQLLAEGKLEADPTILEHLHTFLPRREEYLKNVEKGDLAGFMEPKTSKPLRNNGQMSNILGSYERALNKLEEKKMIPDKSERQVLNERIEYEKPNVTEEETWFKIGGSSPSSGSDHPVTLNQLKNNLANHQAAGKATNFLEDAIVKEIKEPVNVKQRKVYHNSQSINHRLAALAGYSLDARSESNLPLINKSSPISDKSESTTAQSRILTEEASEDMNPRTQTEENQVASSTSHGVVQSNYKYPTESERQEFLNEEKSIEGTFFWTDENQIKQSEGKFSTSSHDNVVESRRKQDELNESLDYPLTIEIPFDKKGKGLTFRVNDCYYDDDGQFLYRVPGMTK